MPNPDRSVRNLGIHMDAIVEKINTELPHRIKNLSRSLGTKFKHPLWEGALAQNFVATDNGSKPGDVSSITPRGGDASASHQSSNKKRRKIDEQSFVSNKGESSPPPYLSAANQLAPSTTLHSGFANAHLDSMIEILTAECRYILAACSSIILFRALEADRGHISHGVDETRFTFLDDTQAEITTLRLQLSRIKQERAQQYLSLQELGRKLETAAGFDVGQGMREYDDRIEDLAACQAMLILKVYLTLSHMLPSKRVA